MKNSVLKKMSAIALAGVVTFGSTGVVNASTVATAYGKMTYTLTKPTVNQVMAKTSMPATSKVYSYVKTTLEVQNNATGTKIYKGSAKTDYKRNTNIVASCAAKNLTAKKLAGFSCHELVGQQSYAKYKSEVF